MMRRSPVLGVVAIATTLVLATPLSSQAAPQQLSSYLVQLAPGGNAPDVERLVQGAGGQVTARWTHALQGFAVDLPDQAAAALAHAPGVGSIEPDGIVTINTTQDNVPSWGIDRVDKPALPLDHAYGYANNGSGVTAYVIDTGIAPHAEFVDRLLPGQSFISDSNGTVDCNGHGTHVSGTIGGSTFGVAKGVSLVPVRVLDCTGSGSWSGVVSGIDWVAGQHLANGTPAVANMSLGGGLSSTVNSAVAGAVADGVTMVVAAGNDNRDACRYSPASESSAITVGATGRYASGVTASSYYSTPSYADERASYSNFGTCLDVFAPGTNITSSWLNGGTNTISGTSMATPHVVGIAARYLQANPGATPAEVTSALLGGAAAGKVTNAGTGSPNLLADTAYIDSLVVPPPPSSTPAITTSSLPNGTKNVAYNATLGATGGVTPYSWSVTAGSLPTGLTLGSTGTIGGTPSAAGTFGFTVTVTDSASPQVTATKDLSITVVSLPGTPTNLKVTFPGSRKATFTWNSPTDTGGLPVSSYAYRVTNASGATLGSWTTTSTTATVNGFTSGATYFFYVKAVTSAGSGPEAGIKFKQGSGIIP
jgi:subtilisin family serine protease